MQVFQTRRIVGTSIRWQSVLAIMLLFGVSFPSAVGAEVKIEKPKQTVYLANKNNGYYDDDEDGLLYFDIKVGKYDYIVEDSTRTDNEMAVDGVVWSKRGSMDRQTQMCSHDLSIAPEYPGIANIFFEDEKQNTYTVQVEILPYENPLQSIRITNINNGKSFAGNIEECNRYHSGKGELGGMFFQKDTAAPKLKVKAKDDWQIMTIYTTKSRTKTKICAQSKTVKLEKAKKGEEIQINIVLKNKKNGGEAIVHFGEDWW